MFTSNAEAGKLMSDQNRVPGVDVGWYVPVLERFSEAMPTTLTNTLFTSAQERTIFLQYNYCRYRVLLHRKAHQRKALSIKAVRDMLAWHEKADHYRSQIAGANLALVLAMIKRMKLHDFDFADLISEGNLALLRAIDKFDVTRGFKFSTYACRAIIKAFSRFATRRGKRKQIFPVEFDPEMEKSDHVERKNAQVEAESVEELRQILRTNAADLSPMEQEILTQRFAVNLENPAINTPTDQTGPLTLNQVGALIGLTKERVRQIQNKAMEKLRAALQERALA
ncbi:MAG: sigma-70 family RNA polymerase sigma factor [Phycisphaerales bacterium]|nr:sigma-70 family RNA polymerase sigma factor [Phycisphaerales bacterium]